MNRPVNENIARKYILAIKNLALKVAYFIYDNGRCSMKVAETFFKYFFGSVTIDGYNVYKLFDRESSRATRYGCMAHVRQKFVDAVNRDSRSAEILSLISELYWIESNLKINFMTKVEREKERKRHPVPVLSELGQRINAIFDKNKGCGSNLFTKAVRYAVSELETVCRLTNGRAKINNNAAERMMKPIYLGRNNYLFCVSELGARNVSLLYSIIETWKMNGVRPVKFITDMYAITSE